jgi:pseudaminic acid cytidylyltransferase
MRRLALIPARGGSKRLKRKNVVDFDGRPLICHTIAAALETALFDSVVVSTEDDEIAAVAAAAGARVLRRPPELAADTATVNQNLLYALDALARQGEHYDRLCCLYATAPLRTAADIVAAHRLLDPPQVEFVIAVARYPFPPYQALIGNAHGFLALNWPEYGAIQSQRLPEPLVDNGSTYWADVGAYRAARTFYGERMVGYEMPLSRSIDIDTADQLEVALALHRAAQRAEPVS